MSKLQLCNWSSPFLNDLVERLRATKKTRQKEANSSDGEAKEEPDEASFAPGEGATDREVMEWLMVEVVRLSREVKELKTEKKK